MSDRMEELEELKSVQHPRYPWLKVDMRTQPEVEESRTMKATPPIMRLARKAKKMGQSFVVNRDLDGAYRIRGRLDERKALKGKIKKGKG